MRETILASNLIRKLNFMRSATLAICLGLLPSQVTAQTCETVPDCATLGYDKESCDGPSLKCPFNENKLFCVECASDQMYDSANKKCEDGKIYCANQGKGKEFNVSATSGNNYCRECSDYETELFNKTTFTCEDGVEYCATQSKEFDGDGGCKICDTDKIFDATNKKCVDGITYCAKDLKEFRSVRTSRSCVSCSAGYVFNASQKKCVNCATNEWEEDVPSNNVCIWDGSLGTTCYRDCESVSTSICGSDFTGYVYDDDNTVTSVEGGTIGIVREDGYYKPYKIAVGEFTYSESLSKANSAGGVLPTIEEATYINYVNSSFASDVYWTSTLGECGSNSRIVYPSGCQNVTYNNTTGVMVLKKCASK